MNFDNGVIKFEEIPFEVMEQIRLYYTNVSFAHYGEPFVSECTTRSFKSDTSERVDYALVMDSETFQPVVLENAQVNFGFKVRAVFAADMSLADVYSVEMIKNVASIPETIIHRTTDPDYDELLAHIKEYRESRVKS